MSSPEALRRSPRKRGREGGPASQTVAPSGKARRTRSRKDTQLNTGNLIGVDRQLDSSPRGPEETGVPVAPLYPLQSSGPPNELGQQGQVTSSLNQQAQFSPSDGTTGAGAGVAARAGPVLHHPNHFTHIDQHTYQPPFLHNVQQTSPEFRHPPNAPPHGAWHGYPYGYAHPYALPPQSGYAQSDGSLTHYNQAQPPPATPNVQFPIEPGSGHRAQVPSRLPNAQFGVDPARLAAPPSFPRAPSSEHMFEPTRPTPSPVLPRDSAAHQQRSPSGRQPMQTVAIVPPSAPTTQHSPPNEAPQTSAPQTIIPISATGDPLIVQQPPMVQNRSNQGTAISNGQLQPPVVMAQVEDDEEEEEEEDDDDVVNGGGTEGVGRAQGSGTASSSTQSRTANARPYQATGKSLKAELKEKWDAEARAKGYNPDKPPSGVNPWAGFVEGVGIGQEEDPRAFYRKNYLYPPFTSQSQNTRTYKRWMGDLMTRIEDISRRTGCLFYVIAHHANSGQPYTWYASPKLRRKAPDALVEFHGLAAQAIVDINNADAGTKMGLVGQLNRTKAQHKAALDELGSAQATIEELRSKLRDQDNQDNQVTVAQQSTLTLGRLQGL